MEIHPRPGCIPSTAITQTKLTPYPSYMVATRAAPLAVAKMHANKVLAHPGPSLAYIGRPKTGNMVPMKPLKMTATARAEGPSSTSGAS